MNTRAALVVSLAVLCVAPCASAQSLKDKLKKAAEKAAEKVEQTVDRKVEKEVDDQVDQAARKVKQKVGQQIKEKTGLDVTKKLPAKKSAGNSDRDSELERRADAMLGPDGNRNAEDEAPTVRLPETHTALFAPLGYPIEAEYGVKKVKPSTPPKNADDQVKWSEKLPHVNTLDNQSLVDEYVLLNGLFEDGYIVTLTPAHWRYEELVKAELWGRVNALNGMVSKYNEIKDEYKMGDDTYNWVINGLHNDLVDILSGTYYKTVLRSSLKPIFTLDGFISDDTKKYFEEHGGYENALSQEWTVWDPQPDKKAVFSSDGTHTGVIVGEDESGATVDIEGITYVLHNGRNGGAGHAFISEVVKVAVDGKDVVIPDNIDYNGKKYPVTVMRGDSFRGCNIKSVKLSASLEEISNSAFRETPIQEIVIPASVRKIQGSAFYGCTKLAKVTFEGDSMQELHGCFQNCTSLKSIALPRNVGRMSYSMFEGCTALADVRLPDNLKEIYQNMFKGCKSLKNLDVPSGVTKVGSGAFSGSGITSLDLSNVTEFESFCFNGCNALGTVKLNAGLKENFLQETYTEFMQCPLLEIKYVNNEYVYPKGLIFVEGK